MKPKKLLSPGQIFFGSMYKFLHNNHSVTVVGFLDAGLRFYLLSLSISSKEDQNAYEFIPKLTIYGITSLESKFTVKCITSDQDDSIMNALSRLFTIGSYFYHLIQNHKRKRTVWNIHVSDSCTTAAEKQKHVRKEREILSRHGKLTLDWLASYPALHVLELHLIYTTRFWNLVIIRSMHRYLTTT